MMESVLYSIVKCFNDGVYQDEKSYKMNFKSIFLFIKTRFLNDAIFLPEITFNCPPAGKTQCSSASCLR